MIRVRSLLYWNAFFSFKRGLESIDGALDVFDRSGQSVAHADLGGKLDHHLGFDAFSVFVLDD